MDGPVSGLQPPAVPVFYPGADAVTQLNVMAQALTFLEAKVVFRARRAATGTVTKNSFTTVPWDTIDEDGYGGWAAASPTVYTVQAPGWYSVTGTTSITGTGATGTVIVPTFAIDGTSPTGQGSSGWEGPAVFIPASGPQAAGGYWEGYCNIGDQISLAIYLSGEPAANFAWQTAAGQQTRMEIVWMGV